MTSYKIIYVDENGERLRERIVNQKTHWDACQHGWDHTPAKAVDFQVLEVDFAAERQERAMGDAELLKALETLAERVKVGMLLARGEATNTSPTLDPE